MTGGGCFFLVRVLSEDFSFRQIRGSEKGTGPRRLEQKEGAEADWQELLKRINLPPLN
jgi:hypothetical protein